jgi:hypothetical protein
MKQRNAQKKTKQAMVKFETQTIAILSHKSALYHLLLLKMCLAWQIK